MIAKIYRLKSGRILLVIANEMLETKIYREVESVAAAKEIMRRISSEWEQVQEIKIYQIKERKNATENI